MVAMTRIVDQEAAIGCQKGGKRGGRGGVGRPIGIGVR